MVFLLALPVVAQQGIIRGSIYDDATGETLIGVTVLVEETTKGSISDIDGNFELRLDPGVYNLQISYISYATLTIQGVEVKADEITVLQTIRMKEDVEQLEEIVVTAEAIKTTEEALLTLKQKSVNLMDGISSSSFKKIGDSDAAQAVKRVPGVSIEGGKYVYVRGLGDRYTKSTLNGLDVPGLDPDRNTIQMDMFSTNVIDNIIVLKSFTADKPADFTGGIVDISTKDFPEERVLDLSISAGYNPSMHFNSSYLKYNGGSTDWLGFDDGTRKIPTGGGTDFPTYSQVIGRPTSPEGLEFQRILGNFNKQMGVFRSNSGMDYGFGFNFGDQRPVGSKQFGYNLSLSYKNETKFYEGAEYGTFGKLSSDIYELDRRILQRGDFGENDVFMSGLAGFALKGERAKYRLNLLHSQNGNTKAGLYDYISTNRGSNYDAIQHNLEYSQRSLSNLLISGDHRNLDNTLRTEWRVSPTYSRIYDPDIRSTRIRNDDGNLTIGTESGIPSRIWRNLEEINIASRIDLTKDIDVFGNDGKLKFGGGHTYKTRDYEIQNFQIIPQGVVITEDPNILFESENLWPLDDAGFDGTRYEPSFIPFNTNKFAANVNYGAAYFSGELSPSEKFKASIGLRTEIYQQRYTGINQQRQSLDNELILDDLDFFPTVNLIWGFKETQNLRFSFTQTIARPSFKEASFAEIIDPISGRTFIGGLFSDIVSNGDSVWDGNLTSTKIINLDIRWELFQKRGQTIAASVFYKNFDRPIEIVQYVQAQNNFQPRNVGTGQVYGIEFEARKNLDFLGEAGENFNLNGNVTLTESSIEMNIAEYNSRVRNARDGQTIDRFRDMAGQAPYILNLGLSYQGRLNGVQAGLFYNVQGSTLTYVGIADRPDVYSVPFNSLNFNGSKTFGAAEKLKVGFRVENILNSKRQEVYRSYEAADQTFELLQPRTRFTLSLGYKFLN
jgi:hypothetical protein